MWNDINCIFGGGISEINLFSEPISMKEIMDECFVIWDKTQFYYDCDSAVSYDLISRIEYPYYWGNKNKIITKLKTFTSAYGTS